MAAQSQVWDNFKYLKALGNDKKNVFYFILKALFAQDIENLSWIFLSCKENGFNKNIKLFPKFMTAQAG